MDKGVLNDCHAVLILMELSYSRRILLRWIATIFLSRCLDTVALRAAAVRLWFYAHRKGRFRFARVVKHHWTNSPSSRRFRSWCFSLLGVSWWHLQFHCCLNRILRIHWSALSQSPKQPISTKKVHGKYWILAIVLPSKLTPIIQFHS